MSTQVKFEDSKSGAVVASSGSLPSSQQCTTQKAKLENGRTYIATVQTTAHGSAVASSSNGIIVDNASPTGGKLAWGPACSDLKFYRSTTGNLQLCWHTFSDTNRSSGGVRRMFYE